MIATLPAVTRERLRRFMRIVRMATVIGAGVGAVHGVAIAGPGARSLLVYLLISIPIGVIDALLMASEDALRWLSAVNCQPRRNLWTLPLSSATRKS